MNHWWWYWNWPNKYQWLYTKRCAFWETWSYDHWTSKNLRHLLLHWQSAAKWANNLNHERCTNENVKNKTFTNRNVDVACDDLQSWGTFIRFQTNHLEINRLIFPKANRQIICKRFCLTALQIWENYDTHSRRRCPLWVPSWNWCPALCPRLLWPSLFTNFLFAKTNATLLETRVVVTILALAKEPRPVQFTNLCYMTWDFAFLDLAREPPKWKIPKRENYKNAIRGPIPENREKSTEKNDPGNATLWNFSVIWSGFRGCGQGWEFCNFLFFGVFHFGSSLPCGGEIAKCQYMTENQFLDTASRNMSLWHRQALNPNSELHPTRPNEKILNRFCECWLILKDQRICWTLGVWAFLLHFRRPKLGGGYQAL